MSSVAPFTVMRPLPFCVPSMTTSEITTFLRLDEAYGPYVGVLQGRTYAQALNWFWMLEDISAEVEYTVDSGSGLNDFTATLTLPTPPSRDCGTLLYESTTSDAFADCHIIFTFGAHFYTNSSGDPVISPPIIHDSTTDSYTLVYGIHINVIGAEGAFRAGIGTPYESPIWDTVTLGSLFSDTCVLRAYSDGGAEFEVNPETYYTISP